MSSRWFKQLNRNKALLLMVLPAAVWFILFSYLPMIGTVIAFKEYRYDSNGFFASILNSKWVGFDNFKFLFQTNDAWMITRNTILYNFAFIVLGLVAAVTLAICLVELTSRRLSRTYQTAMLMPYFLSWIIVSYFVFSFLSSSKGLLNQLMRWLGLEPIYWYNEPKYWPYLFIIIYLWKFVGYNSVMYLAAIMGIDRSLYEAAMIDGAGKWKQILHITLPQLSTLMTILTLLAVGKIFYADFGLFYQVPRNSGLLYSTTNVIDTFVYRGLKTTGEIGMSTAAGFYQSVVGFVLVLLSNNVVRKLNKDNALF